MGSKRERPSAPLAREVCENLVEEVPAGVCVVQGGRIVYANRWLREVVGSAAGGPVTREAVSLFHPGDREQAARRMQRQPAGEADRPGCTVRLIAADGGCRDVELFSREIDYRGRPAVMGTLVDITQRLDAERTLQEHAARLEESNRFRQLFGDILSHDLMNPVWIAENYLRLVMDGGVPDDKRPFYDGMRNALAKARGILADARTYLKLRDMAAPSVESTDIGELVEAVAQSLRPLGDEKGQTITVTRSGSAVVAATPLIREVAGHLLSNAIKFGPPGSEIEISVSAGPPVRLEVRDRGPGVPEEARERIFLRFGSMDKGPIAGVGLGLAIVRRIVTLHGGHVWVEENPGGGSNFIAEFPTGR